MDKVYLERPNICEVLQEKIRKYKRQHPRFSGSQIARKWGLSTSSLNRIENGDIRNPTIDQSIKVLKGVGIDKDVVEFIRTYYPDIHESLFAYYIETSDSVELEKTLETFFQDESTYKMMLIASTKNGLSENYVLQEYGRSGHKKFMKLAANGYLINKNGNFFIPGVDIHLDQLSSFRVGQNLLSSISQEFLVKGAVEKTDYRLEYHNVDFEKIKDEVNSLINDFHFELKKVIKNKDNFGEDIFVSSQLFTLLDQKLN